MCSRFYLKRDFKEKLNRAALETAISLEGDIMEKMPLTIPERDIPGWIGDMNRTEEYLRMEPELLLRDQDAGQISMFL